MGYEVESLVVGLDTLLRGDISQILNAILNAYTVEVVDLAAREDRGYNLMLLGGRKDKYSVARRLLECLKKGVEGRSREHMYLVDDEDRVTSLLGNDAHLLDEVADIIDRVVRRSIEFVNIERASLVERAARLALVAGLARLWVETVDRLGEDTRTGGLAHTARAAEEVGVSQLAALDGVLERRGYVSLTHNRCKRCGAILTC